MNFQSLTSRTGLSAVAGSCNDSRLQNAITPTVHGDTCSRNVVKEAFISAQLSAVQNMLE